MAAAASGAEATSEPRMDNNMSLSDSLGLSKKDVDLLERDPRAALHKYATYNPTGVKTGLGSAYDSQPTILAESTAEEEQEKKRQKRG